MVKIVDRTPVSILSLNDVYAICTLQQKSYKIYSFLSRNCMLTNFKLDSMLKKELQAQGQNLWGKEEERKTIIKMSRQDEWRTMGSCHDMWGTFTIVLIANKFK